MSRTVALLATLDTKGPETEYLRDQLVELGSTALVIDIGVVGESSIPADITRAEVAAAGGRPLPKILENPTRQSASPVMVAGATRLLTERIEAGSVHAVVGLGGTQGTSNCTQVMQALPYGFPKIMVSTMASGDTAPFVGLKDITMMFSVSDILGLNPLTRQILANAAGAAHGMAQVGRPLGADRGERPVVAMTNLGVLTEGAMFAVEEFHREGCEVIVFHAVGSGGRAMEQMMKDGLIDGVFDYALGEISDDLHQGLRAGGPERLTVAGKLGIPQVLCPGGAEHVGLFVDPPNTVPERYRDHKHVFHNPQILAPRLNPDEMKEVAREIARRLAHTRDHAVFLMPLLGTSRYATEGMPLYDPEGDRAFLDELRSRLPDSVGLIEREAHAEDRWLVREAVGLLSALVDATLRS